MSSPRVLPVPCRADADAPAECICNGFAELSRFADRQFYEDWWNATSWDEFSRKWNKPVHTFLLRHVYASSISSYKLSRSSAMFFTFLLSAAVHELVMAIVTKKIRCVPLPIVGCSVLMTTQAVPLHAAARADPAHRGRAHARHQAQQAVRERCLLDRALRGLPAALRRVLRVLTALQNTHLHPPITSEFPHTRSAHRVSSPVPAIGYKHATLSVFCLVLCYDPSRPRRHPGFPSPALLSLCSTGLLLRRVGCIYPRNLSGRAVLYTRGCQEMTWHTC